MEKLSFSDKISEDNSMKDWDENDDILEFQFNKPINKNEFDLIISFFENPKLSGGGNITQFFLDSTNQNLSIIYQNEQHKKRVLSKRNLFFKDFEILVNEPLDLNRFQINNRIIILTNVSDNIEKDEIKMYAESLVLTENELNDVDNIVKSKFFENTYFIKFKLDIDIEKCMKKFEQRSTLRNQQLQMIFSYKTNMFFINLNKEKRFSLKSFQDYVTGLKKVSEHEIESIRQIGNYLLFHVKSDEVIVNYFSKKKINSEYLYSFDLLKKIIKEQELYLLENDSSFENGPNSKFEKISNKMSFKNLFGTIKSKKNDLINL